MYVIYLKLEIHQYDNKTVVKSIVYKIKLFDDKMFNKFGIKFKC